jgi:hypothetical protein
MLNLAGTRIVKSLNRPVLAGVEITAEGTPLVNVVSGGIGYVKPCAGGAGERFAGFALSRTMIPGQAAYVEPYTVTAGAGLLNPLQKSNVVAGQIRVDQVNADGSLTNFTAVAAPATAGHYSLTGNVVSFHANDIGKNFSIQYRYVPSAVEAVDMFGVGDVGGVSATAFLSDISIITEGDISTSEFDGSVDWSAAGATIYLGPNGLLTTTNTGGNSIALPELNIIAAPNSQYAFLSVNMK